MSAREREKELVRVCRETNGGCLFLTGESFAIGPRYGILEWIKKYARFRRISRSVISNISSLLHKFIIR